MLKMLQWGAHTVIGMNQKLFKSETIAPVSGLCCKSENQKFQANHEFEGCKR